jgi:hypothetical protein
MVAPKVELPLAVADLAEAADLLGQPVHRVRWAAARIQPYPHVDGRQFYSLRKLARQVHQYAPRQGGIGRLPFLTPEQAEAAVPRARTIGTAAAAAELGVSKSCLFATWRRLGIPGPGHVYIPREHPRARALTRSQAELTAALAREIGRDQVADLFGIGRWALTTNWRLWGIPGPGRAHATVIRERRRRERAEVHGHAQDGSGP